MMYKVNKETVIKLIIYNYGSIRKYCRSAKISRTWFYEIINKKHRSLDNRSLKRIANAIYLKPEEITSIVK